MSQNDEQETAEPVRIRKTTTTPCYADPTLMVHCPRHGVEVELPDCFHCARFIRLEQEPGGRILLRCAAREASVPRGGPATVASLRALPLSAVMNRAVHCVLADTPLSTAARLLIERDISGAPVVDAGGSPLGMISKTDIVRALWGTERPDGASWLLHADEPPVDRLRRLDATGDGRPGTVEDVMMPIPFTLLELATVGEAIDMMLRERVHRVPVVSACGRVVGIVTATDVLARLRA